MASVLYQHNLLKNNKKVQAQGYQIQNMLQKVSNILSHLLQDLQIIYRSNGVNYQIGHFHTTLIRILTPFELLTQFGLSNNSDLINFNEISSNHVQRSNHMNYKNQLKVQSENSFQGQDGNLNLIPKQYSNSKSQKPKPKLTKNEKSQIVKQKRDITKPVLSQDAQNEIAQWALSKLKLNHWVRRIDLAEKAIKLSTVKDFKASSGWIKNFFVRHPEVLQAMRKKNQATKGKKKCELDQSQCEEQLQLNDQDDSQQIQEQSKDDNEDKEDLHQQNNKKKHKAEKKYEKQLESEVKIESFPMNYEMSSINYNNNSFQFKQPSRSYNERPSMNRIKYNFLTE